MSRVFISYRRADSAGYAGRLYEHLEKHLRDRDIFMDIDSIPPGADFVDVIESTLAQVDTVLVLIGPHWVSAADASGQRRLDDPQDFVRMEIKHALENPDKRVIPVLVNDAVMPGAEQLPDDLKPLVRRNAFPLSNLRFAEDVARLADALTGAESAPRQPDRIAPPQASRRAPQSAAPGSKGFRRLRWLLFVVTVFFLLIGVFGAPATAQVLAFLNVLIIMPLVSLLLAVRNMLHDGLYWRFWVLLHVINTSTFSIFVDDTEWWAALLIGIVVGVGLGLLQTALLYGLRETARIVSG